MSKYTTLYAKENEKKESEYYSALIKDILVFINGDKVSTGRKEEYIVREANDWLLQMEQYMDEAAAAAETYMASNSRISELEKIMEVLKEEKSKSEKAYFEAVKNFRIWSAIHRKMKSVSEDDTYVYHVRLFESEKKGDMTTALAIALKSKKPIFLIDADGRKSKICVETLVNIAYKRKGDFADIICKENEIEYHAVSTPTRFD